MIKIIYKREIEREQSRRMSFELLGVPYLHACMQCMFVIGVQNKKSETRDGYAQTKYNHKSSKDISDNKKKLRIMNTHCNKRNTSKANK